MVPQRSAQAAPRDRKMYSQARERAAPLNYVPPPGQLWTPPEPFGGLLGALGGVYIYIYIYVYIYVYIYIQQTAIVLCHYIYYIYMYRYNMNQLTTLSTMTP